MSTVALSNDKMVNLPKQTPINTKKNKPKITQKVASIDTQNHAPNKLSTAKQPQVKNNPNKKIGELTFCIAINVKCFKEKRYTFKMVLRKCTNYNSPTKTSPTSKFVE